MRRQMVAVAPLSALLTTPSSHRARRTLEYPQYQLVPWRPLPFVDLSVSIRSRFLSQCVDEAATKSIRRWRIVLDLGYTIGLFAYAFIIVSPRHYGRIIACVAFAISLPGSILSPSMLRYDLALHVARTYDFWFCVAISSSAFTTLGLILGDIRGISVLISVLGALTNLSIDANLRVPKSWVFFNLLAIAMHLCAATYAYLGMIDGMWHFDIVRVRGQSLPAPAFAANGLLTVCAVLLRNVYRRHDSLKHQDSVSSTVRCVAHRVKLKFVLSGSAESGVETQSTAPTTQGGKIQQLRYESPIDNTLDAMNVLAPWLLRLTARVHDRTMWRAATALAHASALAFIGVYIAGGLGGDLVKLPKHSYSITVLATALAYTTKYCGIGLALSHRRVLHALVTSFNFVFLSLQMTIAHVCVCDFFRWTTRCVVLALVSWIWIHTAFCLDAMTPTVRSILGIHVRFAGLVVLIELALAGSIIYWHLVSSHQEFFDRVVWEGSVFGRRVEVHTVPVFYNCIFNALAFAVRFAWRSCTASNSVLLLLDGAVVYENPLICSRKAARQAS